MLVITPAAGTSAPQCAVPEDTQPHGHSVSIALAPSSVHVRSTVSEAQLTSAAVQGSVSEEALGDLNVHAAHAMATIALA